MFIIVPTCQVLYELRYWAALVIVVWHGHWAFVFWCLFFLAIWFSRGSFLVSVWSLVFLVLGTLFSLELVSDLLSHLTSNIFSDSSWRSVGRCCWRNLHVFPFCSRPLCSTSRSQFFHHIRGGVGVHGFVLFWFVVFAYVRMSLAIVWMVFGALAATLDLPLIVEILWSWPVSLVFITKLWRALVVFILLPPVPI